ncbi:hypothetical protein A2690_03930 [Candidatus Roizmanbacteria bacterium RIFCSPHIGHO2_01_FULL_39_12b]|uniref:Small ribosomal subunit protein uS5 n=1 Tax=Candidatus Roizmanbacteria bacterium RIFCSPHIGHO2_01_FULL_39_12b TaxID=1802030 RepID=A0A1F7GC00_9BACT|nr:MAG: hypothetical protein A2690_03930 [Candidatus Roizmanbacteria bacterium RIFCSPHIGHO2_01_FULL_39_12b]OGK47090.1 MAG: hypothetical protein A3B46_01655 [Candidatus Roizmanbacteria bacterium RIFCSPLOWO2_01_FULL_39_19]
MIDKKFVRETKSEFDEKVLVIRRISKKTPGGNYITFSALVAIGDHKNRVGLGLARSLEVPSAIAKAISKAKKSIITLPITGTTIPQSVRVKYKAATILLKPAPRGAGLKVGSVVRSILNLAGVDNASAKIIRSRNKINNAYATILALKSLRQIKK